MVHSDHGLFSTKKKRAIKPYILNAYYQVKEANPKKLHTAWFQLHFIPKKRKTMETGKRSVTGRGLGGEGWTGREQDFERSEDTLQDTIMIDTFYIFSQTLRKYNTKSEPNCKLWTEGDYEVST